MAYKYLEKATEIDDSSYIKHEMGDNLIRQGLNKDAYEIFSSLDLDSDIYTNLRLAYFSIINDDFASAEELILKALSIDSCNYNARMFFGAICLWKGDLEQAVRSYKVATEENPYSSVGFVNLAAAY